MSGNNGTTKKHIFKGAFAALLAAAVIAGAMTGCSKSKSSNSSETNETQVVTQVVSGVYVDENGNAVTDANGDPIPASEAPSNGSKDTSKSGGYNSKQSSSSNQKSNGGSDSKKSEGDSQKSDSGSQKSDSGSQKSDTSKSSDGSRVKTPSGASDSNTSKKSKEDSSAKTLSIGGKEYKVGDKVVCTYFLEVPETMLNFQGRIEFDSSMLKKTKAYLVEPATYSSMFNDTFDNRIFFNGSNLSGYDYTAPGYEFIVVEYEVLKTGSTEPAITFEVVSDLSDKAYADSSSGKLINGAKIMSVYS